MLNQRQQFRLQRFQSHPLCQRSQKQRLQFHQLKHAGGPQFQCPYCDLKLMTPGTLQKHIQGSSHTHLRQVHGKYVERKRVWLDKSFNLRNFTIPSSQMIRAHLIQIFYSTNLP